ncbi:40S ribosomal protein S5-1 [Hordeum vulgare]|nr:40S ribosomal protein S5-1 [Hordeum vulgare]
METRLKAMEQQVFKCQGMVERGLNANHMMITEFTDKHRIDTNDIGKHLSTLYERIDQLQAQIYDMENQNSGRNRNGRHHSVDTGAAPAIDPAGREQHDSTMDPSKQRYGSTATASSSHAPLRM